MHFGSSDKNYRKEAPDEEVGPKRKISWDDKFAIGLEDLFWEYGSVTVSCLFSGYPTDSLWSAIELHVYGRKRAPLVLFNTARLHPHPVD